MTNFTRNLMLAVAACTFTAGTAAAQTYKAEIPFGFRVGNTAMAPGTYEITMNAGHYRGVFQLRNAGAQQSILAISTGTTGSQHGPNAPALRFECAATRCSLGALWVGGYEGSYLFPKPNLGRGETARVETIGLTLTKAD